MSVSVIKLRLGRCWQKSWHDWFEDSGKNLLPACSDLLDQEIALIRRVAAPHQWCNHWGFSGKHWDLSQIGVRRHSGFPVELVDDFCWL